MPGLYMLGFNKTGIETLLKAAKVAIFFYSMKKKDVEESFEEMFVPEEEIEQVN